MADSSEDEVAVEAPVETKKPNVKDKKKKEPIEITEPVIIGKKKEKKVFTEAHKKQLDAARAKGLEKLTEMRRKRKELKEQLEKEKEEGLKIVQEKKLDAAPKVREIDSSVAALRAEMEALKKQLAEAKAPAPAPEPKQKKVKKIIYEDDDDDVEEVVEVVRKKSIPKQKNLTGTELLDKLFFQNK